MNKDVFNWPSYGEKNCKEAMCHLRDEEGWKIYYELLAPDLKAEAKLLERFRPVNRSTFDVDTYSLVRVLSEDIPPLEVGGCLLVFKSSITENFSVLYRPRSGIASDSVLDFHLLYQMAFWTSYADIFLEYDKLSSEKFSQLDLEAFNQEDADIVWNEMNSGYHKSFILPQELSFLGWLDQLRSFANAVNRHDYDGIPIAPPKNSDTFVLFDLPRKN